MTELYAEGGRHVRPVTLEDVRRDLVEFLHEPRRRWRGTHAVGEIPATTAAHVWEANGLFSDLFGPQSSHR